MNNLNHKKSLMLIALVLLVASLACQTLFPKVIAPSSLEERIAEGDIRFEGSGNVTYIGCQDPTAVVSIYIGPKTKELDGNTFSDFVNPVTVNAVTDGTMVRMGECQKSSVGDKYDWPVKGIYYPNEDKILFFTCTQNNERAEGEAFLVGEGFEGEYACWDRDGGLMYEVAISAYQIIE